MAIKLKSLNTHGVKIDFGQFYGMPYTRVPVHYLKWMINARHKDAALAEAELKRRGTVTPELEISGHAIDRASQQCLFKWKETRKEQEGLHAWLVRMSQEALLNGAQVKEESPDNYCTHYNGMKFVFEIKTVWPVLKTILRV